MPTEDLIQQYIDSLTQQESLALEIARDMLEPRLIWKNALDLISG